VFYLGHTIVKMCFYLCQCFQMCSTYVTNVSNSVLFRSQNCFKIYILRNVKKQCGFVFILTLSELIDLIHFLGFSIGCSPASLLSLTRRSWNLTYNTVIVHVLLMTWYRNNNITCPLYILKLILST